MAEVTYFWKYLLFTLTFFYLWFLCNRILALRSTFAVFHSTDSPFVTTRACIGGRQSRPCTQNGMCVIEPDTYYQELIDLLRNSLINCWMLYCSLWSFSLHIQIFCGGVLVVYLSFWTVSLITFLNIQVLVFTIIAYKTVSCHFSLVFLAYFRWQLKITHIWQESMHLSILAGMVQLWRRSLTSLFLGVAILK